MALVFWQLGPLAPPPLDDYRLEFEFWSKACGCLFLAAVTAAVVFVLLFRYSERFQELCARCVEKHGSPSGNEKQGGV
jgi:hypothetical protein